MARHHQKNPGAPGVQLGLIITPMLDMAFQILSFFIMTYHPSSLEAQIPGNLAPPEKIAERNTKDKDKKENLDPLPSLDETELDPKLDNAITVKVRSVVKGQFTTRLELMRHPPGGPLQIFIKGSLDGEPKLVADNIVIINKKSDTEPITPQEVEWDKAVKMLKTALEEMAKGGAEKTNIKLAPDGDLQQEYVMKIFDACKQAGFGGVHFVPPPVLNSKIK